MYPNSHLRQEIAREHAAMLRDVRLERLAELTREERERSPLVQVQRFFAARGLALLRRGTAQAPFPAPGPAA